MAFSLTTGDPLWQSPLLASAIEAPTVANGILWVVDLSGSLFQFDASNGALVKRLYPPDDGAGFFSRPIVDQDAVYSGGGSFFYAMERP
jgi:outer membrane protein assembly factor BamB